MRSNDVSPVELVDEPMSSDTVGLVSSLPITHDSVSLRDRPTWVFFSAFAVRVIISAVFLGSCDTLNAIAAIPTAAAHGYFLSPVLPGHRQRPGFVSIGGFKASLGSNWAVSKLIPCFAYSLIAVLAIDGQPL